MVSHIRRLVCLLNILRPPVRGAFLIDLSRTTTSFRDHHRKSPYCSQQRMTTPQQQSNTNGAPLMFSNSVGQKDIGRQLDIPQSDACEDDGVVEKSDRADGIDFGGDETSTLQKSWRDFLEISIARSRKIRGSNYVQIATVDSVSNEPRCRTVVFRGFLGITTGTTNVGSTITLFDPITSFIINPVTNEPLSCIMKMCTDSRSEKVQQTGPTEVVWWFPKTSEQYRIRGTMKLIGNDNATNEQDRDLMITRKEMWGSLTDSSRESFLTTPRPGDVFREETSANRNGGRDENGKIVQPPPDTFLLMLVIPNRCDYLNLTNMFRQVDTLNDGKWQAQRVNA